jgi:tRNA(Ile)-lysidine synthase
VQLVQRVRATGLVPPGRPLLVLLSGGRDSTCLLDIAVELVAGVRALHVNYGLRGEASDADEEHCRALCERLGVALDVERAAAPEGNLQAWARDVRYAAGARAATAHGASLAAGHTATDQVETILYRLMASPGRRALLGMDPDTGTSPRLVRPLLAADVTREETATWCLERGLAWREDASNLDRSFSRARVREDLLPMLRAVDERAERNILRTAEILREEAAALDEVVSTALAGGDRISLERLAALRPALARLVLRRLAEDATGRLCPRAPGRLGDVLGLQDGALDLGDGARAVVQAGVLRVTRTPPLPRRPVE